jgi:error-prone DNA polymerase
MLAGGYTPGEADQLRRDMSAWKSTGRIERHRDRLIGRMVANGIPREFAERIFSQIRGFGEYGFPESHAASFAVIVYAAAFLRCHYPAAFACSLLNAQPMGFYSPATIVEDARRHGVEVRPIDVQYSSWDCSLEKAGSGWSVRMGLRYVKGLGERERETFAEIPGPYRDLEELVRRTGLSEKSLLALAEAGAFQSLEPHRRKALWAVREIYTRVCDRLLLPAPVSKVETEHLLSQLSRAQEIFWDYRTSRHSVRGHPMLQVRPALKSRAIPDAATLNALSDGAYAKYVGMVICRQQPGTARKVTFYTLEDETGFVNLVVWFPTFERYSVLARTALLLGVTGHIQSDENVVFLIADALWEPALSFKAEGTTTRNFH